jgi:hypothetical protein
MTVETCLSLGAGSVYVGLEHGRECWWGNTLTSGTTAEATTDNCNMVCAGSALEYCGAGNHLTLYTLRNTTAPPSPYVPSVGNYHLVGCYAEPSGGRALASLYADDSMTPAVCVGAAGGATYVGLEYGRECWYGNAIAAGAVLEATNDNCAMACAGDAAEYCGAGNHLLVYQLQV